MSDQKQKKCMNQPKAVKIKIDGRVISKKNSKQIFRNRYTGAPFIKSSDAYAGFGDDALRQLQTCQACFFGKVRIDYVFEIKGQMRIDVDNAMASINDILQKAGVIDDDNNVVKGSFEKVNGMNDWTTYVEISKVIQ